MDHGRSHGVLHFTAEQLVPLWGLLLLLWNTMANNRQVVWFFFVLYFHTIVHHWKIRAGTQSTILEAGAHIKFMVGHYLLACLSLVLILLTYRIWTAVKWWHHPQCTRPPPLITNSKNVLWLDLTESPFLSIECSNIQKTPAWVKFP